MKRVDTLRSKLHSLVSDIKHLQSESGKKVSSKAVTTSNKNKFLESVLNERRSTFESKETFAEEIVTKHEQY
jgi:polysaccharide pyruvyl transferase WcaK-like protein